MPSLVTHCTYYFHIPHAQGEAAGAELSHGAGGVGEEAAEDKQALQVGVDGCSFPSFLNLNLFVLTLEKKIPFTL
jgi:hypothetical protein